MGQTAFEIQAETCMSYLPFPQGIRYFCMPYCIVFLGVNFWMPYCTVFLGVNFCMPYTPNANMADHSVVARDELHESEVSQSDVLF